MFLTREELIELTGYKLGKKQCKWLARNGYKFDVRADGRPAVARALFEPVQPKRTSAFNLAALDALR